MAYDLVILLLTPIILSLFAYLFGRNNPKIAKYIAVVTITFTSIYTLILWIISFLPSDRMTHATDGFLLVTKLNWIPTLGISFAVGVDGLSMPLLALTQIVFLVSVFSSFYIHDQEATYYSMLLVLLSGITGTFVSLDLFLFYISWELVLVPMFFLIHIWGGPNRRYAAVKFFIYTHLASLLMLIGLFLIYIHAPNVDGSYTFYLPALEQNIARLYQNKLLNVGTMSLIFWLVFIGFVTKFPQVPVHTWLPDAHVQAPSPGSAILAGLLLKMGGYGLIRIPFWLFGGTDYFTTPEGKNVRLIIAIIGVVSMVYPAFIALRQDDLKRMIAYSSISHMGIVLLGIASYTVIGFDAAIFMMIAHGIISPGLFLLSGVVEHNTKSHTRLMSKVGGLAHKMPFVGGLFVFLGFASAGLPGLAGFVAEFNAFVGLFSSSLFSVGSGNVYIPVIAVLSVIITAGYYLWAIQRVIFNDPSEEIENTKPGKRYEVWPILALAILALLLGLVPNFAHLWDILNQWSVNALRSILP